MKAFKVAILGCGTVGGGVARILLDRSAELSARAGAGIELSAIVDLFPDRLSERHGIPRGLFRGEGPELTRDQATSQIREILDDETVSLVVETIGGTDRYILDLATDVLERGKHLVTANKALLAMHGKEVFGAAVQNDVAVGFEASVCGAIPIIKALNECETGDEVLSVSGIMNGTSNYILSSMESGGRSFGDALREAQQRGYAEADPTLDVNGGDAGHKLAILLRIVFGLDVDFASLPILGIQEVNADDLAFAREMNCSIKLVCYASRNDGDVFATVRPMMVKHGNLLSKIGGATNAVRLNNLYSRENLFVGQGAGSLETASAIAADIVFIARYGRKAVRAFPAAERRFRSFDELPFPYNITFETADVPGITGLVATAIGGRKINIDTVSHNRRDVGNAVFCIVTAPCTANQIRGAISDIRSADPRCLLKEPKVTPILEG